MSKKGYTLVELIGVIVLLAVIMTLVTTGIIHVIKTANKSLDENTKKILYNQAESYLNENVELRANGTYRVSVGTLIKYDKISSNLLNGFSNDEITTDSCIVVRYSNGTPSYEFKLDCTSLATMGE